MSRSGYSDDTDNQWAFICWRGAVASAIRGARGQLLLAELLAALDAMPEKQLIADELEKEGQFCTLGVLGHQRGLSMDSIDPEDYGQVAKAFSVAGALVQEIEFMNDDFKSSETTERRWTRMRAWVASQITKAPNEN